MDRAGRFIQPLGTDEFRQVFDLVASGGDLKTLRCTLRQRHKNTVARAYGVARQLHLHGDISLTTGDAEKIAQSAGYLTTASYVRRMALQYSVWRQERRARANPPAQEQDTARQLC